MYKYLMPLIKHFACGLLLFCCSVLTAEELTQSEQEAALKSAYLVNFARFVRWPEDEKSVVLCLGSESEIYPYISTADMLDVGGARELIISLDPVSLENCHLFYVDVKSREVIPPLGENVPTKLLTVTDIPGSLSKGFAVQFFLRDLKLRFAVNEEVAKTGEYHISSKLMRMARRLD